MPTTTLHPQFRPPVRVLHHLRPHLSSSSSLAHPRTHIPVRASAASASTSAPAQREATAGVPWGCEIESLENAALLERWLVDSGLPEQRLAIQRVDIGERGLVALKNIRKGEKLLFVPPSLVITADSVLYTVIASCRDFSSSYSITVTIVLFVCARNGAAPR
jgi:hypothetical protein